MLPEVRAEHSLQRFFFFPCPHKSSAKASAEDMKERSCSRKAVPSPPLSGQIFHSWFGVCCQWAADAALSCLSWHLLLYFCCCKDTDRLELKASWRGGMLLQSNWGTRVLFPALPLMLMDPHRNLRSALVVSKWRLCSAIRDCGAAALN